jgi:hypothetical protein
MIVDHTCISANLRQKFTVTRLFFASRSWPFLAAQRAKLAGRPKKRPCQRSYGYAPTPHKAGFAGTPNLSQENSRLTREFSPRTLEDMQP